MTPSRLGRWGCLGLVVALTSGCSDVDATCSSDGVYAANADTVFVEGPEVSGEVILSAEATSFGTAFEAVLDQLPEVWVGDEPLRQPTLAVRFELEYPDSQPPGAELPPVTATLDTGRAPTSAWNDASQAATTLGGPQGATAVFGVAPFVLCSSSSMQECCAYGASSCSGAATLQLSRKADVFPRVRVRYTATPSAQLYSCVEDEPAAKWTLEETGE